MNKMGQRNYLADLKPLEDLANVASVFSRDKNLDCAKYFFKRWRGFVDVSAVGSGMHIIAREAHQVFAVNPELIKTMSTAEMFVVSLSFYVQSFWVGEKLDAMMSLLLDPDPLLAMIEYEAISLSREMETNPEVFKKVFETPQAFTVEEATKIVKMSRVVHVADVLNVFRVDWRSRKIVHTPTTKFQSALFKLLQSSQLAKKCANPDCLTPYFIAPRSTRQFCSDVCAQPAKSAAKLRWWNRVGKKSRMRKKRG